MLALAATAATPSFILQRRPLYGRPGSILQRPAPKHNVVISNVDTVTTVLTLAAALTISAPVGSISTAPEAASTLIMMGVGYAHHPCCSSRSHTASLSDSSYISSIGVLAGIKSLHILTPPPPYLQLFKYDSSTQLEPGYFLRSALVLCLFGAYTSPHGNYMIFYCNSTTYIYQISSSGSLSSLVVGSST
jgi:hypothetical protein